METLNNYSGYNTYIIGATKNIVECLRITLYNKSEVLTEKISLYNLSKVYEDVIKSEKYLTIERDDKSNPFIYDNNNGIISGFNVIIYINVSDNSLIGYTEFLSTQGKNRGLNISLDFNTEISGDLNINIVNSLTQLKNNSTVKKQFIGDKLYNYTTSNTILKDIEKDDNLISPKYTTHLSGLGKSKKSIIMDNFILTDKLNLLKLWISRNINVDLFGYNFENYQLSYYNTTDIAIYSWKDLNYCIYSLTKTNKFGNPLTYTPSSIGYITIPGDNKSLKISYFSGKYIIVKNQSTGKLLLYDSEIQQWIYNETDDKNFVIDLWDPSNKIISLPKTLLYTNVLDYIPEIFNSYFDFKDFSKNNNINLEKKIGDWYVIKQKGLSEGNLDIYTSITKTIIAREEETVIPINNQVILVKSKNNKNEIYYTVYTGDKEIFYTEQARCIVEKGTLEYREDLGGIMFCNSTSSSKYEELYNNLKIRVINSKTNTIIDSYFSKFRKNIILDDELGNIPEIIGSIAGIIFFKKNNYINYL